jgi:hypothetical protein
MNHTLERSICFGVNGFETLDDTCLKMWELIKSWEFNIKLPSPTERYVFCLVLGAIFFNLHIAKLRVSHSQKSNDTIAVYTEYFKAI